MHELKASSGELGVHSATGAQLTTRAVMLVEERASLAQLPSGTLADGRRQVQLHGGAAAAFLLSDGHAREKVAGARLDSGKIESASLPHRFEENRLARVGFVRDRVRPLHGEGKLALESFAALAKRITAFSESFARGQLGGTGGAAEVMRLLAAEPARPGAQRMLWATGETELMGREGAVPGEADFDNDFPRALQLLERLCVAVFVEGLGWEAAVAPPMAQHWLGSLEAPPAFRIGLAPFGDETVETVTLLDFCRKLVDRPKRLEILGSFIDQVRQASRRQLEARPGPAGAVPLHAVSLVACVREAALLVEGDSSSLGVAAASLVERAVARRLGAQGGGGAGSAASTLASHTGAPAATGKRPSQAERRAAAKALKAQQMATAPATAAGPAAAATTMPMPASAPAAAGGLSGGGTPAGGPEGFGAFVSQVAAQAAANAQPPQPAPGGAPSPAPAVGAKKGSEGGRAATEPVLAAILEQLSKGTKLTSMQLPSPLGPLTSMAVLRKLYIHATLVERGLGFTGNAPADVPCVFEKALTSGCKNKASCPQCKQSAQWGAPPPGLLPAIRQAFSPSLQTRFAEGIT